MELHSFRIINLIISEKIRFISIKLPENIKLFEAHQMFIVFAILFSKIQNKSLTKMICLFGKLKKKNEGKFLY